MQGLEQAGNGGRQRDRRAECGTACSGGALQLVLHDVIHAADLFFHPLRCLFHATQHRQRGLQAVRQIGQGMPVSALLGTFVVEQGIEVVGELPDFTGVVAAQFLLLAVFYGLDLARHLAQRAQPPGQCGGERQ